MNKRDILLVANGSPRKECINKEFMGGYGWAFNAGSSARARLINYIKKRGESLPLMSFGYLAAIFRAEGHRVSYWDTRESRDTLPEGAIAIISSSMVDHHSDVSWIKRLKAAGLTVGVIGPFSSAKPELYLPTADFVVRGEPEAAAARIAKGCLEKGIVESKPVSDLDSLAMPDWDGFPYQHFSYLPVIRERPFFPIITSRGCAFHCNYCPYTVFYAYRSRSVENVIDEVEYLVSRYSMKGMLFRDPLFTGDKKRSIAIAEAILRKGFNVIWACETRLDLLDEELLRLFYRAGCRVVNVGIESSDPSLLENVNRRQIDRDYQKRIVDLADRIGIRITAFYILGLPGETPRTLATTIAYAKWLNTHVAQFFIYTPFPGTPEYEKQKDNLIERDWERFDCFTPVIKYDHLNASELSAWKEMAFNSYYYRPRYLWHFMIRTGRALIRG